MIYQVFEKGIDEIELEFGRMSRDAKDRDRKKKLYWGRFQNWSDNDFKAVVESLIAHFEPRSGVRFPLCRDFIRTHNSMTGDYDSGKDDEKIPENERATQVEISLMFEIVNIILKMHQKKRIWRGRQLGHVRVVDKNSILYFDDWEMAGRPPTWSPVYDEFAAGAVAPYRESLKTGGNDLVEYMVRFREYLTESEDPWK